MVGSIIGGVFGMMGANQAASAAERAAQTQRDAQVVARSDLSPWRSAGQHAIDEAIQLLGLGNLAPDYATNQAIVDPTNREQRQREAFDRFRTDPGYRFRQQEGQKAIDRSAAARGGALSGAAVKAGQRFASGLAEQEFINYFNRLAGVAGMGGSAAATGANAITATARGESDAEIEAGRARQSGYNALGKGLSTGVSNIAGFGARAGWW